jgi:hypothetical protein
MRVGTQEENGQCRKDVPYDPHPYDGLNKKTIECGASIVLKKVKYFTEKGD